MTLASVGSPITPAITGKTFPLTPAAVSDSGGDHFIVVEVISTAPADFATALSSSNVTWDASPLVAHTSLSANGVVSTVFKGKVTAASLATVTVTTAAGSPSLRVAAVEGSSTAGYSAVTLDVSGTVNAATTLSPWPGVRLGESEFYFYFGFNSNAATAGSTSGFTYGLDPSNNGVCFRGSCGSGAQQPSWGVSDTISGIAVLLYEAVTSFPSASPLSGSGSLAAAPLVTQPAAAALSGSGTVAAAGTASTFAAAALVGLGVLAAAAAVTVPGAAAAALSGSGTLAGTRAVTWQQAVPLSGSGTVAAQYTGIMAQAVPLSGTGNLAVAAAATLKFTAGLFGGGFLSIPQVAGGLVNGVGGAGTPMALPGSSQVAVAAPGSSNWQWLGTLGQVTALTYSYVCPGGADKMTCAVLVPASFQSQLFYPGWQVKIVRGGMDIWHGKLDQPSYQPGQGWTLTAVGNGNRGTDFNAYYTSTWPAGQPDEVISQAISRGLPWVSPGYDGASFASQFWLGQSVDAGAQTVTAFLNMITSRGALTWYVNSGPGGLYAGDDLQIFPLPTVPNRLLVATAPIARTLGGYVNYLLIRYQASADNTATSTAATYAYTTATNPRSIAAHGQLEAFFDLGDAPVMTGPAAAAIGGLVLQSYVAASYAGPFTVSYGQLLNMGGQPVDIGCDGAASMMVKLVLADSAYGGAVDLSVPVTFLVGSYSYNDMTQTAQVSPYAMLDQSLSGLLSAQSAALTPITVASS